MDKIIAAVFFIWFCVWVCYTLPPEGGWRAWWRRRPKWRG